MCHVLVIEDEYMIADHIADVVTAAGATSVVHAETEADAIAEARARRPEIIMSDVKLLDGTGPAAVERILAELGPIPVIFVTGTPEDCRPCEPPAVVLGKPIIEAEITAHFRRLAPV
jgi:CheY-like chemotaxis protein